MIDQIPVERFVNGEFAVSFETGKKFLTSFTGQQMS